MASPPSVAEKINRRASVLTNHLCLDASSNASALTPSMCLQYSPPEFSEKSSFDTFEMRRLMDGHNLQDRDWIFGLMLQSNLFCPRKYGSMVFVSPDYNQTMEQQREITMKRIQYLLSRDVFKGWLTGKGAEIELRKFAFLECAAIFDHSLSIKLGVHFMLWGGAIQFFGTKIHHDKWLKDTEDYTVKGCFAMTELGHGSNVRGIETIATYDAENQEFVITTPCESAQKYWIGGAANHATHTIVFSQLHINGSNQGVHAFIAQIRDSEGNVCSNVRIADCGHKIGLNGIDNGRIWFDDLRIPRENLLNSVADVSPDGQYLSAIKDPDQRFTAFLSPLTSGRVIIAVSAIYISKIGLAIAIRYSLTRRAFSMSQKGPEVLLLDYPSHQRRLIPLLAKTYAMSFASNYLKKIYISRSPGAIKTLHIVSSAFKATFSWHNMRTLQECREACGGQGLKTDNRVGHLKSEYDVHSTFEGDNNVLMQQVSKALLAEFLFSQKNKTPFGALGLEHMNDACPDTPSNLSSSDIRSYKVQIALFFLRERELLTRFAMEVSQYEDQGKKREHALLLSYQVAEDLARAFTERAVLQVFMEAEKAQPAGILKDVLGLLRTMYVVISIEEDASFFRYGLLSTANITTVRREVMSLCNELRPHALSLVNSFGIPSAFLSPLAFDWIESNSWSSTQN